MINIKKWSIRKGCMSCGNTLNNLREKLTRQCDECATKALEGFTDMSEGKIKSGFKKVVAARLGDSDHKSEKEIAIRTTIKQGLGSNKKRIEKILRKKGDLKHLSKEEITIEVEKFGEI